LEPIVYDLFLVRLKTDNKQLEAQRMVIVQYNKEKNSTEDAILTR
ncbi:unnamed protein product, partial [Rotaria sp. Silwood1]